MTVVAARAGLVLCALSLLTFQAVAADYRLVTEDFPPFVYEQDGEVKGVMSEMVRAACQAINKTCAMTLLPFRRAVTMVESGEADGIFPLLPTPEREQLFRLTLPVVKTAYSFVASAGSPWSYRSSADLQGRTVVAFGPSGTSIAAERLARQGGGTVEIELSNESMLKKLAAGRFGPDAVGFINHDVGRLLIGRMNLTGLKMAGRAAKIDYVIGLSRSATTPADLQSFDRALAELTASGRLDAIRKQAALDGGD